MIFAARQLQEKCQEQNVGFYTTFVGLTKVFDTVCRKGLWEIMAKFGCPAKFITMVRQFHDGMQASVQDDGKYSKPFPVTNGVKQGCVLARMFFSMMFSRRLKLFALVTSESTTNSELMESCSTYVGFRQKPKFRKTLPETFYLLTTAH